MYIPAMSIRIRRSAMLASNAPNVPLTSGIVLSTSDSLAQSRDSARQPRGWQQLSVCRLWPLLPVCSAEAGL